MMAVNHSLSMERIRRGFPLPWLGWEEGDACPSREEAWALTLVNRWNPVPAGYEVSLTWVADRQRVDSRIAPALRAMLRDARAAGFLPKISSAYRTEEEQRAILAQRIVSYRVKGCSSPEAERRAKEGVALPGTSEHQLGLAVDITSASRFLQEPAGIWGWLNENGWKYGFILRYPEDKTAWTGIVHEPWHYRYVGREAAREMRLRGICLEEYWGEVPCT